MTPVLTDRFPSSTTVSRAYGPGIAVGLVTAVIAGLLLVPRLDTAPTVERVRFDNPNPGDVAVDVTSDRRDGWVGIGPIEGEESETVLEVSDPGPRWVLRFVAPGHGVNEIEISRDDLAAAGWVVQIPELGGER